MPSAKSKTKPKPSQASSASWQFSSLGTEWRISLYEPITDSKLESLQQKINERLEVFDKTYSRFRADSLVTAISKLAGSYQLPDDSQPLFEFYKRLYDATNGSVTPLIGDLISAAGYDADYSFQTKPLSVPPTWHDAMIFEAGRLTVKQPVLLDFGAAGKGYAVDLVAELLQAEGMANFCVNAGGDMVVRGTNSSLQIGLENPDNTGQVIGIAKLTDRAIAGSAGNRRKWGAYHHIMDPKSLTSTMQIKASWAIADSVMLADGLATALFFVPPANLKQFKFEYFVINENDQFIKSAAFPAEIFGA